jgi:4-aminobutyrate aminotransferase
MLAVEFDTRAHAEEVQWAAFQRGLLVLECGRSTVRMSPALTVTEEEMATAVRLFSEAVDEVATTNAEVLREVRSVGSLTGVEAAI